MGNNTFAEDESAAAYIWKNAYDEQTKQIQMELTLFEKQADGRYVRFNESQIQRAHSQREMEGALKRAGFERIEAFDAFHVRCAERQKRKDTVQGDKAQRLIFI